MPKIRREGLPPALLEHLLARIRERGVAASLLVLLAAGLDREPEVPEGRWFKRFPGELVKTFLTPAQTPSGDEFR